MKMNLIVCPFCGERAYNFKERAACSVCDRRWNIKDFDSLKNNLKGGCDGEETKDTET